ncbi:bifunctional UDP-sugar hydrolase/5'-nucleotidase [Haladaptatus halobius]|uniref:bifunctional UDP-sugar hydrolase/5'-nucleotidase n=1 Tax=Haladaptatus halobius TaxID=2884875 RepID=UPI0034A2DE2F
MGVRLLHYSDVENAYDSPDRIGRLAGTIQALRDDTTLVLGTGDNTAPGVLALVSEGRQSLDFFTAVTPDAETFGNHDFDFGPNITQELIHDSPQVWLSANITDGDAAFAEVPSTLVIERAGTRIGLTGVTDPETADIHSNAGLTITDPVTAVQDAITALQAEDMDHIVVLAHLREEYEREIAESTPVDVVLGGHVHSERCEHIAGTVLLRPGATGRSIWEVNLSDHITTTSHSVADGPLDEHVANRLRERMDEAGLTEMIATVKEPIHRDQYTRYGGECRIANFVTDAYRWATGADVSVADTGGIRDGPPLAGEVTVADVIGISPFEGQLYTLEVSGAEIHTLLENMTCPEHAPPELPWWGHFSGMHVTWDLQNESVHQVTVNSRVLDPNREYTVAAPGFVVQWDGEFSPLSDEHVIDEWGIQYEALLDYAHEHGLTPCIDGRIIAGEGHSE